MPQIPQYVSKESPTAEPGAVARSVGELGGLADSSFINNKEGMDAANQLNQLGSAMRQVEIYNAESKSNIQLNQALLPMQDAIRVTDDPKVLAEYRKEYQKIIDQTKKNFPDMVSSQKWDMQANKSLQEWDIKQQGVILKNQINTGQANTLTNINQSLTPYISSNNEEERVTAYNEAKAHMDNAVKTGLYGADDGMKVFESQVRAADRARDSNEQLKARKVKEASELEKAAKIAEEKEIYSMAVSRKDRNGHPVSPESLITQMENNPRRDEKWMSFKKSVTEYLGSPKAVNKMAHSSHLNDVLKVLNDGRKKDGTIIDDTTLRKTIMDEGTLGKLSQNEVEAATTYLDMVGEYDAQDVITSKLRSALGAFWFKTSPDDPKVQESNARMSLNYIGKLQKNMTPDLAAIETRREEILTLLPDAKNYPEGMKIRDNNGNLKIVMPNGDIKDYQPKTK